MNNTTDFIKLEAEIERAVSNGPRADEACDRILMDALKTVPTARFFTKYAKDPKWLEWLRSSGLITSLFQQKRELDDVERLLSAWIANSFIVEHGTYLIQLIQSYDNVLNSDFWYELVRSLSRSKTVVPPYILRTWIYVLLRDVPVGAYRSRSLDRLLRTCSFEHDPESYMTLFCYLIAPISDAEISIGYVFSDSDFKFDFTLDLRGDRHALLSAWESVKSHLAQTWRRLLPTVEKYLVDAYTMNLAFGKAAGDEDIQSFFRSAIEPHEQDRNNGRAFDALIDVARDTLEYLLGSDEYHERGVEVVHRWYESGVPLLRRAAIHGVGVSSAWSYDEKITWLIQKQLVYNHWYKHEAFQVIKGALASCSPSMQRELADIALAHNDYSAADTGEREVNDYERYNLLYWMNDHAPSAEPISSAYAEICKRHPNFLPRDYPDLNHWIGGASLVRPHSPKDSNSLKSMGPKELAEYLSTFKETDEHDLRDERRGLLDTVSTVVTQDFDWSLAVANSLVAAEVFKRDVWHSITHGWTVATLNDQQLVSAAKFLIQHGRVINATQSACGFLEAAIKDKEEVNLDVLEILEELSDALFKAVEDSPAGELWSENWLSTAINHDAGKLAEFWLQALHKRGIRGASFGILPERYKERIGGAISSDSFAGSLMTAVLVSRLQYLYFWDADWTRENILSLLDFDRSPSKAKPAWHGFLVWGQVRQEYVDDLKPLYLQAIERLTDSEDRSVEQLHSHIAQIQLDLSIETPDMKWFYEALELCTESGRERIVNEIWQQLPHLDEGMKRALWNSWLRQFWQDRANNQPIPLSEGEGARLIECTPWLAPVFDEAVGVACVTNEFRFEWTHLYSDLLDLKLTADHPESVARLLIHTLSKEKDETAQADYLQELFSQLEGRLPPELEYSLKNVLKKLGVI